VKKGGTGNSQAEGSSTENLQSCKDSEVCHLMAGKANVADCSSIRGSRRNTTKGSSLTFIFYKAC
jgi:hypothetical protein